jgi:hypothetical protein
MNNMWTPPMKRGYEITLLIIEMAIRKSVPLFLRKIHMNAVRFSAAKTAAFAVVALKSTAKEITTNLSLTGVCSKVIEEELPRQSSYSERCNCCAEFCCSSNSSSIFFGFVP